MNRSRDHVDQGEKRMWNIGWWDRESAHQRGIFKKTYTDVLVSGGVAMNGTLRIGVLEWNKANWSMVTTFP
jgi:hypothetical protein